MRKTSFLPLLSITAGLAVCLSTFFFFTGCESADSYTIDVSPSYSDVSSVNQSVRLTASGWSDYTWNLSNTDIGYLTSTHGESVTYVAKEIPTSTSTNSTTATYTLQTITVTAKGAISTTTTSDGTNTTSTSSEVYTGKAIVRHVGG